jgi:hypothetical protein
MKTILQKGLCSSSQIKDGLDQCKTTQQFRPVNDNSQSKNSKTQKNQSKTPHLKRTSISFVSSGEGPSHSSYDAEIQNILSFASIPFFVFVASCLGGQIKPQAYIEKRSSEKNIRHFFHLNIPSVPSLCSVSPLSPQYGASSG